MDAVEILALRRRQIKKVYDSNRYRMVTSSSARRIYHQIQIRRRDFVADPMRPIWVKPALERKIYKRRGPRPGVPGEIVGGDWDRDFVWSTQAKSHKIDSIVMHLQDGIPWEQTPLFGESIERRLEKKGRHRGSSDPSTVRRHYAASLDRLIEDVRKNGFAYPPMRPDVDPIFVHLTGDGSVLWAGGGNHRVTIAVMLGLESIPVFVWRRHEQWQSVRERVGRAGGAAAATGDELLAGHPDLQDL